MSLSKTTDVKEELRVLVIGKTGSGKSGACNKLLMKDVFRVYYGMSGQTREAQCECTVMENVLLKVVDTPDIVNVNMKPNEKKEEIQKWLELVAPYPYAILLMVRCDIRYTEEDFEYYEKMRDAIKEVIGQRFTDYLIVGFTRLEHTVCGGSNESGNPSDVVEGTVRDAGPDLSRVFEEAGHRFVVIPSDCADHNSKEIVRNLQQFINQREADISAAAAEREEENKITDAVEDKKPRSICKKMCILSFVAVLAVCAWMNFDYTKQILAWMWN